MSTAALKYSYGHGHGRSGYQEAAVVVAVVSGGARVPSSASASPSRIERATLPTLIKICRTHSRNAGSSSRTSVLVTSGYSLSSWALNCACVARESRTEEPSQKARDEGRTTGTAWRRTGSSSKLQNPCRISVQTGVHAVMFRACVSGFRET